MTHSKSQSQSKGKGSPKPKTADPAVASASAPASSEASSPSSIAAAVPNLAAGQHIPLETTWNTRDLGGYIGVEGRKIRPGRLIRSDNLTSLTQTDCRILTGDHGLARIVDFRGTQEIRRQPDRVPEGVAYTHLPIIPEEGMDGTESDDPPAPGPTVAQILMDSVDRLGGDVAAYNADAYRRLVSDPWTIAQYRRFIQVLADNREGAVLWHCAAGKDRTGMGAVLILSILGVDEAVIYNDYLVSNVYLSRRIDEIDGWIRAATGDYHMWVEIDTLCRVLPRYYHAVMDAVSREWKGLDGYIREALGLDDGMIQSLRDNYLEEV